MSEQKLRPGQVCGPSGLPLWRHVSTDGAIREMEDDGWMDVNGWEPVTVPHAASGEGEQADDRRNRSDTCDVCGAFYGRHAPGCIWLKEAAAPEQAKGDCPPGCQKIYLCECPKCGERIDAYVPVEDVPPPPAAAPSRAERERPSNWRELSEAMYRRASALIEHSADAHLRDGLRSICELMPTEPFAPAAVDWEEIIADINEHSMNCRLNNKLFEARHVEAILRRHVAGGGKP